VRRLVLVPLALSLACSLHASVSLQTPVPAAGKKQAVAENHELRSVVQTRYQKAIRDKAPVTAAPADGKSFVNEFLGTAPDNDAASDANLTSSQNPDR
jgi:hypothetical protein